MWATTKTQRTSKRIDGYDEMTRCRHMSDAYAQMGQCWCWCWYQQWCMNISQSHLMQQPTIDVIRDILRAIRPYHHDAHISIYATRDLYALHMDSHLLLENRRKMKNDETLMEYDRCDLPGGVHSVPRSSNPSQRMNNGINARTQWLMPCIPPRKSNPQYVPLYYHTITIILTHIIYEVTKTFSFLSDNSAIKWSAWYVIGRNDYHIWVILNEGMMNDNKYVQVGLISIMIVLWSYHHFWWQPPHQEIHHRAVAIVCWLSHSSMMMTRRQPL